ncbi:MAG TPA: hypothetical protein DCL38_06425, partial [Lachnospiraceae bacterium]|nr:hypothetical protein [Lachnospiraceae bacterium]
MKRGIALIMIAGLILCAWPAEIKAAPDQKAQASEEVSAEAKESPDAGESMKDEAPAQDNLVTTKHEAVIKGKKVPYTAETG